MLALTNNDSFNAVNNSNKRQLKQQNRNKQSRNLFGIALISFRNNSIKGIAMIKWNVELIHKSENWKYKTSA